MNAQLITENSMVPGASSPKRFYGNPVLALAAMLLMLAWSSVNAQAPGLNTLEEITYAGTSGNRVRVIMKMSHPVSTPASFTIDNPARIAFDLPATKNGLAKRSQSIGIGPARSVTAIESKGRTRVVLNLVNMVPYETRTDGNEIIIELGKASTVASAGTVQTPVPVSSPTTRSSSAGNAITGIDFRRGTDGEGRVVIDLSNPGMPVDMRQESGNIIVDFKDAQISEELQRRLDVTDFATPVTLIDTKARGNGVRLTIKSTGNYEHLAYQSDDVFTVEVRKTTKEEKEARQKKEFGYTGERLSLNFQNIEVRSVLQLLADFTGTNIVVSDTVSGNLTLRMQNVPWDQALDIVLKTKGLAKRDNGNVMMIAPSEEIAAREKLELEAQKQIEELVPLYSDYIQVNYAKAADLASLLQSGDSSLMSDRGKVTIDDRTNILLVQDTAEKLAEIRQLVSRLDVPVRQVLIESRIVLANNDFARDLGVKFGLSGNGNISNGNRGVIGGVQNGTTDFGGTTGFEVPAGSGLEGLVTNLPALDPSGSIGLALGKVGSQLLQLELSAMQLEDRGEVISSPRVITSNQQEAVIQQGVEIPYQQASSSGATSVSFKEAVLQLKVTPQITPDDHVIMDLQVNKDTVGQIFAGVPSVDTQNVSTRVLVDNGETLVLGGIYEQERGTEVEKVPFFGDIPGLGYLFRTTRKIDNKNELLIFVTPKIIKQDLASY